MKNFVGANYYAPMDAISEVIVYEPKIVQCIQAFNEESFIWYTLKSIYNAVDYIRVVEGAVENQVNATRDGHSTDKTVEIIKDFIEKEDPDKKVLLIQIDKPWKNLEEIKQQFLKQNVFGEWNLISDADEIYKESDIKLLKKLIEINPTASEFVPLFLHFYGDFEHIAKPGPEWQPQHQRFYRYQPRMTYKSHPIVTDRNGQCTYFSPHYQYRRFVVKDWYVWHYGYSRPNMHQVLKDKQEYYNKELVKHGGANKPFDEKVNIFLNNLEKNEDFCSYSLEDHPTIIHGNPMFSYKDPKWNNKQLQSWKNTEPYCLDKIPNIWLWMSGLNPRMPKFINQVSLEEIRLNGLAELAEQAQKLNMGY